MSTQNVDVIFDKVKKVYCQANPHRNLPENRIAKEKLSSSKAGEPIYLEHDIFYEDAWFYTNLGDKEGSRLICGVDYELEDEDSIATDQSGWRCYKTVRILKSQEVIWVDYEVYGDFIDANIFNLQVKRTKESMQEIADLYRKASEAESRLSTHEERITSNENGIRSNLAKINRNSQEIESAKNAIGQNTAKIESTKAELAELIQGEQQARTEAVAGVKGEIKTVKDMIGEVEDAAKETKQKLGAIVPVGFCYIQPQGSKTAEELWPQFSWKNVLEMEQFIIWKRIS